MKGTEIETKTETITKFFLLASSAFYFIFWLIRWFCFSSFFSIFFLNFKCHRNNARALSEPKYNLCPFCVDIIHSTQTLGVSIFAFVFSSFFHPLGRFVSSVGQMYFVFDAVAQERQHNFVAILQALYHFLVFFYLNCPTDKSVVC